MDVSGQLHAPAALLLGKEPLVPIGWEAEWAPEPVWTWWWQKFPVPTRNVYISRQSWVVSHFYYQRCGNPKFL